MATLWAELGAVVVQFAATSPSHRLLERFFVTELAPKGTGSATQDDGWQAVSAEESLNQFVLFSHLFIYAVVV